jgi:hypothetical protein
MRVQCKKTLPIWLGYMLVLMVIGGCATSSLLSPGEMSEILTANKAIILFRITVQIDGKPAEAFGSIFPDDNVGVAVITDDHVRRIYVIQDPGTHYLAVQPPRDRDEFHYQVGFRYAPRWRIDVLAGSRIIYAGRLHIDASTEKRFLFSRRVVYEPSKMTVKDERMLADDVAAKFFPELGPPIAVLMEPLGEP